MEDSIGKLCSAVAKFCNHLETNCSALRQSVERRPIPLDSASTTFVQSVNRRISAAGGDLNMLESMAFATVSFEELLGHCTEVLKKNQSDIYAIEDHLRTAFNYIPPLNFDEEDDLDSNALGAFSPGSQSLESNNEAYAEQDALFDDSLSLKNFGISDVSLASIASQGTNGEAGLEFEMDEPEFHIGDSSDDFKQYNVSQCHLSVSREDYESLPKHMKGLASWEDLVVAVEKLNSYIQSKKSKPDTIQQDEIELLDLGYKARSYLLLLIKMNRLCVETNEGVISYKVLQTHTERCCK
ncbi:uncharacterized protein LOC127264940 [Andrographis paniculata]|uniref:uncharacterized protein LOC127264940 n=1 Tax=Andrographis paniculata TaxID=175694 RepID=UPI0021E871B7|nr:uncharacterized protein LOC127264940 [Andrographis paniculata]